jgi:hypothetical protein
MLMNAVQKDLHWSKLTDPASHGSFYRTGFHGHCCIAFPFFCLLKNLTVFISESWGQRFLSWCIYWHLVGVSLEPAIHDGMHTQNKADDKNRAMPSKATRWALCSRVGSRFVRYVGLLLKLLGLDHTLFLLPYFFEFNQCQQ